MSNIPDDLKPKRIDDNTVEFLGINFVSTPAVPRPAPVAKPANLAKVKLVGNDGNAFAILAACQTAGRRAGYTKEQLDCYKKDAMSGNYDHLLMVSMDWFDVE